MFVRRFSIGFVILAVALQAMAVFGQRGARYWPASPVSPQPPELGFSYHHASTALEGALRGRAQLTYATGAYWLALSQSLICREEACQLALENRKRFVEDRRSHWGSLEDDRQRRVASRRKANEAARQSTYEVYRLTSKQLDRSVGKITWPKALLANHYDEVRLRLDDIFRVESQNARSLAGRAAEVADLVRTMSDNLRHGQSDVESAEYLATQKFLCGVKLEAEYPFDRVVDETARTAASSSSSEQGLAPWELN